MHRWISMTLFPTHEVRWVRETKLKLLYAIVKKIKVAPVKEMCKHMFDVIRMTTSVTCTSLVTRIASAVGTLNEGYIENITIPRILINEQSLF